MYTLTITSGPHAGVIRAETMEILERVAYGSVDLPDCNTVEDIVMTLRRAGVSVYLTADPVPDTVEDVAVTADSVASVPATE